MNWWGRIKGWLSSKDQAAPSGLDGLVDNLRIMSVGSYLTMADEFPQLREISSDKYDFFMANAAVSMALYGIEAGRSEVEYHRALRSVEDRLRELWGEDAARAILDCNEFVEDALPSPAEIPEGEYGEALIAAVGMWIVWNLFGEEPKDDQMRLVSVLGRYAVTAGGEYWE